MHRTKRRDTSRGALGPTAGATRKHSRMLTRTRRTESSVAAGQSKGHPARSRRRMIKFRKTCCVFYLLTKAIVARCGATILRCSG